MTNESSWRGRTVEGRRADLRGLRNPESLDGLEVKGRGIASIAGLERAVRLSALILTGLVEPDLRVLATLPRLEHLTLAGLAGTVDYRPVGELAQHQDLTIESTSREHAEAVAEIDFAALGALDLVSLSTPRGVMVELDLSWLPRLSSGAQVVLDGYPAAEGHLRYLCEATQLRSLSFTPRHPGEVDEVRRALSIWVEPVGNERALLEEVEEYEGRYSAAFDLVDRWGVDDNEETGEQRLRRLVAARDQALERRLTWDPDVAAVWVIGDSRDDVQIVKDIVDSEAARRGRAS